MHDSLRGRRISTPDPKFKDYYVDVETTGEPHRGRDAGKKPKRR
jgi:hypothetical protein